MGLPSRLGGVSVEEKVSLHLSLSTTSCLGVVRPQQDLKMFTCLEYVTLPLKSRQA